MRVFGARAWEWEWGLSCTGILTRVPGLLPRPVLRAGSRRETRVPGTCFWSESSKGGRGCHCPWGRVPGKKAMLTDPAETPKPATHRRPGQVATEVSPGRAGLSEGRTHSPCLTGSCCPSFQPPHRSAPSQGLASGQLVGKGVRVGGGGGKARRVTEHKAVIQTRGKRYSCGA